MRTRAICSFCGADNSWPEDRPDGACHHCHDEAEPKIEFQLAECAWEETSVEEIFQGISLITDICTAMESLEMQLENHTKAACWANIRQHIKAAIDESPELRS